MTLFQKIKHWLFKREHVVVAKRENVVWPDPPDFLGDDMLHEMWQQQKDFMLLLQEKRGQVKFPVDMETKAGQRVVKEYLHECAEEVFEAIFVLNDAKAHRKTKLGNLDRAHLLDEMTDAAHYLFESAIFAGFTAEEFYNAYMKKGCVNVDRINTGY